MIASSNHYLGFEGLQGNPIVAGGADIDGDTIGQSSPIIRLKTGFGVCGATYIFDSEGRLEYEHRDTGVLAYSETMPRPLTFLQPYIGDRALNPLGLGDSTRLQ